MQACQCCSRTLSTNGSAISMRLLGRDGRALFCRERLARELKTSPELIDKKIKQFRSMGCPLFV